MFDWLSNAVGQGPLTYLVVCFAAGADVLFPPVPSETMVITASVLAAQGDLVIWFIVPLVALGAFVGDNISYLLGRRIGDPVADRLFSGPKNQARLKWAESALQRRGMILIAIGRFIPGGRTATTFAAGTLEMPYRRFLFADAIAAIVWATYASMLGYLGGETFRESIWLPLLFSGGIAMLVALGFEGWRRLQLRRGRDLLGDELPKGAVE
ncbi:MAG TPA: DedA family protein [Solirubrobacterales bacterium]|nr:DedA family protein [Solirubrobacterales bacterium]